MISADNQDDLPPSIRRRLGLPIAANPTIASIKGHMFGNSLRYIKLVLQASAGDDVDPEELMEAARLAGKVPAIVNADLEKAVAAFKAWQDSVHP